MRPPRDPSRTTSSFRGILSRGTTTTATKKPEDETEDLLEKPHRDWSPEVAYAREYFCEASNMKEILAITCKFERQAGARKEWEYKEGRTKAQKGHSEDEGEVEPRKELVEQKMTEDDDEEEDDPLTMFDVAPEEHKPAHRWTIPSCDCATGGQECMFQELTSPSESCTPTRSSTFSSQDGLSTRTSMTSWSIFGRSSPKKTSPLDTSLSSLGSQTYFTTSPSEPLASGAASPNSLRSWFASRRTSSRTSSARLSQQSFTMMQHHSATPVSEVDPLQKPLSRAATDSSMPPSSASSAKSWISGNNACRTSEIYKNSQLAERSLALRLGNPLQQSSSSPALDKLPLKRVITSGC